MTLATEKGKKFALKQLGVRRKKNKDIARVDDVTLPAGSPMHFYCNGCSEEIIMPENHRGFPALCEECQALKSCGWFK